MNAAQSFVIKLVVILALLSRQDVFTAYGSGTGTNLAHISPFSITTTALFNSKYGRQKAIKAGNPDLASAIENTFRKVSIIGEVFTQLESEKEREKLLKAAQKMEWGLQEKRANRWFDKTRNHKTLSKIVFQNEHQSNIVVVGSLFSMLSVIGVLFSSRNGIYMFLFGIGAMYFGLIMMNLQALTLTPFALSVGATVLVLNAF